MDWSEILTPIKARHLLQLLQEVNYDHTMTHYLVQGFRHGFDIGYRGPKNRSDLSPNLPLQIGTPVELWNKVMKEVQCHRYAGPFETLPFPNFVQSPIGLVPKSGNKTRLIFHLSYDFSKLECKKSVNYHTPAHLCTIHYRDLDHVVRECLCLIDYVNHLKGGQGQLVTLSFGKTDCSNAFRVVLTLPAQRYLLTMRVKHPETGKFWFFIDKCLPFGSSRSCVIFQVFSDGLRFIAQIKI